MALPKPYYQEPGITIYCGDYRDILPHLDRVDLILTSPPYNMGGTNLGYQPKSTVGQKLYGEYSDKLTDSEYTDFIIKTIEDCLMKSRYVFWNLQYLVSTKSAINSIFCKLPGNLKDIFIWKKNAVAQICAKDSPILANGFEFVFLLGQDNSKIFKHSNFPDNAYVPNIQEWFNSESFPEHHATFTQEMCRYFIQYFTKPTDTVMDIFCGTGTTLRSAKDLGRQAIGIDIEEKYCEISVKRLRQEVLKFD